MIYRDFGSDGIQCAAWIAHNVVHTVTRRSQRT